MSFLLGLGDNQFRDFIKAIELLRKHENAKPQGEIPTQVPSRS